MPLFTHFMLRTASSEAIRFLRKLFDVRFQLNVQLV